MFLFSLCLHVFMALDPHLEKQVEDSYYADAQTGEFLGRAEDDIDFQEHESYFIEVTQAEYQCDNCGYVGGRYHPLRKRPTIKAPLHKKCPNTSCRGTLGKE